MKQQIRSRKISMAGLLVMVVCLGLAGVAQGQTNGTWIVEDGGAWSNTVNWLDGMVADGAGATASFPVTVWQRTVTIDTTSRTVGSLVQSNNVISFAASGGATLTFDNNGSGALLRKGSGTYDKVSAISAPVILNEDITMDIVAPLSISGDISGDANITKTGSGTLTFSGSNTYTGRTVITEGALSFGADTDNIGGSGRSVYVANGAGVMMRNINNTYLTRLEETTNAFVVGVNAYNSSAALDFSSSTGATLPNARLATSGGSRTYYGTLTPYGNTYHLGGNIWEGSSSFTMSGNATGVSNSLVAYGPTIILSGTVSYGGDTTVESGTLRLDSINTANEESYVTLAEDALLDLNFTGTQTVKALFVGETEQTGGIYGTNAVAGDIVISQITGNGKLEVIGLPPAGTVLIVR